MSATAPDAVCTCSHERKDHKDELEDTSCKICNHPANHANSDIKCQFFQQIRSPKPKLKKPRPNLTLIKGEKQ